MKRTIMLTLTLALLYAAWSFSAQAADDGAIILAKDGRATAKIVTPDSATPVEQTAAKELQSHLGEIVEGSTWEIITESQADKNATLVLVGNSKLARELFPAVDFDAIPYDGIVIQTRGNKLLLAGHETRGTLYAVTTFLEDTLGCRWWTSTESTIPRKSDIVVPVLDVQYAPKLIYREAYYKDAFEPVFATRMKCNGSGERISPEWGGHHQFVYFVHSFYPLIPPEKYFETHPEWFSEINGKRTHDNAQLCLTNDEMRTELTKNAIVSLRKNPAAKFISISQNDWYNPCQCEKCQAVAKAEESEAGPLILFVNRVAEDIEKEFPDVWVETLAYQYTRKPPKTVKPRENVIVRLCTIECSFVQPLGQGGQNKSLRDDIEGWSKIAHQLFIWDYVTNFSMYLIPHPNYAVLPENIRFFVDHGTIGLFEQGDSYTTVGDFIRPRNWVISHLMWNPSLDENALLDDFLNGYYGEKAAPLLWEYMNLLVNRANESGVYLGCFRNNTADWLDYDTLCKATELMNRAIEATSQSLGADSPKVWRLRREKMPVDYVWLQEYHALKRYAAVNQLPFLGPQDPFEGCNAFFTLSDRFGNAAYREYTHLHSMDEFKANLLQRFGKPAAPPDFCEHLPEGSWVDYQEYEFSVHKANGWADYADDDAASNGRTIRMPGDHFEWAISQPLDSTILNMASSTGNDGQPAKFRVYAAVRCEAVAKDGPAMTLGVYDPQARRGLGQKALDVGEINGDEYKL
ncbi:MAG: DUF4838 domain-containing protein, partial [Planctomycetaceae bacterium]|nr:DUF4838 domain-containing protein [Planctomycetaceae bacterium]